MTVFDRRIEQACFQAQKPPVRCYLGVANVSVTQDNTFQCPLCQRAGDFLTLSKHHLVPKSRGGTVIAEICVDCHRQIHALFTLPELARDFGTLDALRTSEPMQKWIKWAGKQGGGRVAVRASHAKRTYNKVKDFLNGAV